MRCSSDLNLGRRSPKPNFGDETSTFAPVHEASLDDNEEIGHGNGEKYLGRQNGETESKQGRYEEQKGDDHADIDGNEDDEDDGDGGEYFEITKDSRPIKPSAVEEACSRPSSPYSSNGSVFDSSSDSDESGNTSEEILECLRLCQTQCSC